MTAQVEKLMKTLNLTEAEALQLIADDKAIDRGAKLFELDPELEAGAKKARQAERKKSTTPVKRERKENPSKREIIKALTAGVGDLLDAGSLEVTNVEREFTFSVDGVKYKVVLSAPRK
jgi:hypothetical protein